MKKERLEIEYEVYQLPEEMPGSDQNLWRLAKEAARTAYAPYSRFSVGAAVLLDDDTVVTGNNQENAAFPSGLCAERVAVFYAGSRNPGVKIKAIAVAAFNALLDQQHPATPCGSCLQAIAEYEYRYKTPIRFIMLAGESKMLVASGCRSLLPYAFTAGSLLKD